MPAWIRLMVAMSVALVVGGAYAMTADELVLVAKTAERGSAASQLLLGIAWLHGDGGLARDPVRAAVWLERSAAQGNAYAEEMLGDLYERGEGVPENLRLAADWREKSAKRGDVRAQLKLGQMYLSGRGVDKDAGRAAYWIERAATEGSAEAQFLLGRMYRDGSGVRQDSHVAHSWLEKSALQGYDSAVRLLHFIEGLGYQIEETHYERQPELHRPAADGDPEAQYQLALRYEHGVGGEKQDSASAVAWYRRAAMAGHRPAMRALAHIYLLGLDGVPADPTAADEWSRKAGQTGN